MKLENKKLRIGVLLIVTLLVMSGIYVIWTKLGPKNADLGEAAQELALVRPTFSASATAIGTTLDQGAGMAIWLNATSAAPLSLIAAQSGMVNVEMNTSTYVVGSISLQAQSMGSDDWPHCIVFQSGWIVVYFLKINFANPSTAGWIGKMFPMYAPWYANDQLSDNLLHKALVLISQAVGVNPSSAQYYNFQYPSATTLEIAIKTASDVATTVTFNVEVPSTETVDEYSWSFYASNTGSLSIGTTTICSGGGRLYGGTQITSSVLTPDIWHTVTIVNHNWLYDSATGCIIILYH